MPSDAKQDRALHEKLILPIQPPNPVLGYASASSPPLAANRVPNPAIDVRLAGPLEPLHLDNNGAPRQATAHQVTLRAGSEKKKNNKLLFSDRHLSHHDLDHNGSPAVKDPPKAKPHTQPPCLEQ